MSMQQQTQVSALVGLLVVAALIVFRKRLGVLNAASWLVIWGSVILLGEHPQFTPTYAAGGVWPEGVGMRLIAHARLHFFMAGIYAIIGLILLDVIARTLLREGRGAGWYSVLFALVIGGAMDLLMGGLWYQHGSPFYFTRGPLGFGWQFLYVYLVAWACDLLQAGLLKSSLRCPSARRACCGQRSPLAPRSR